MDVVEEDPMSDALIEAAGAALRMSEDAREPSEVVSAMVAQSEELALDLPALDEAALVRLAHLARGGNDWMDRAGLLTTDSCGYPEAGGFYDTSSDLLAAVGGDAARRDEALGRITRDWARDYVTAGRARRDRGIREYLG